MNSKRRAELQRKLTLNAVPRPPAGLAERIKADIPRYLEAETVPQRVTRSLAFPMRMAASVMVLAGAVIVAMMVSRGQQEKASVAGTRPVIFAPQPRSMAASDTTTTVAVARTEEVQLDIVQEAPVALPAPIVSAGVSPTVSQPAFAEEVDRSDVESGVEGEAAYGVAGGVAGGVATDRIETVAEAPAVEPQRMAEYAPPADLPVPPPAAAPAPAPAPVAPPSVAQANEGFADAARLERRQERATASKLTRDREAKRENLFGISTSSQVFEAIRTTLESGRRPSASMVDVEALVNYFAGAPPRPPRSVRLEVEASPAAIPAEGEHAVLRFTIDTPAGTGVAATDARIEVVLNDAVVAHAQRIGDAEPLAADIIPRGTSVTGLYALEMKPGLRSTQLVATVGLHYKVNGKPDTITKYVHGRDLSQKTWQRASRRHRLASLGALWAESLKTGAAGGADVAKRAEELATQEPTDVRARELARAANASAVGGY